MKKLLSCCLVGVIICLNLTACGKESKDKVITNLSKNVDASSLVKQLDVQGTDVNYIENSIKMKISGKMNMSSLFAKPLEAVDYDNMLSSFSSEYNIDMVRDSDTMFCKYNLNQSRLGTDFTYMGMYIEDCKDDTTVKYTKSGHTSHYTLTKVAGNTCNTDITFGIRAEDIVNPDLKQVMDGDTTYTITGTISLGNTGFYNNLIPLMLEENYISGLNIKDIPMHIEVDLDRESFELLHYSLTSLNPRTLDETTIDGIKIDYYVGNKDSNNVDVVVPEEILKETEETVAVDKSGIDSQLETLKQSMQEKAVSEDKSFDPSQITVRDYIMELVSNFDPVLSEEEHFDIIKFSTNFASYKVYLYYVHSADYTVYDEFKARNTIKYDYTLETDATGVVTGSETVTTSHYNLENDMICKSKYMTVVDNNTIMAVEGVSLTDMSDINQIEGVIITIVNSLGLEY